MSSTNDDWFLIKDFDNFVNATRALVFNNFGKYQNDEEEIDLLTFDIHSDDAAEIDRILSFDESKIIVDTFIRKQKHKITKTIRYILDDHLYLKIVSALNDRMVSNILNNLVNKGLVESGYDTESNDFVFWIKDDKNIKEMPETD